MTVAEIQADKLNKGRIARVEEIRKLAEEIKEEAELCATKAEEALALWQKAAEIASLPEYADQEKDIRQTLFKMEEVEWDAATKAPSTKRLDYMMHHDILGNELYTLQRIHNASKADCEFPVQRT